jgi:hypothetical protein
MLLPKSPFKRLVVRVSDILIVLFFAAPIEIPTWTTSLWLRHGIGAFWPLQRYAAMSGSAEEIRPPKLMKNRV